MNNSYIYINSNFYQKFFLNKTYTYNIDFEDLQPSQQDICKLLDDPWLCTQHFFHMDSLTHKVLYIGALCRLGCQNIQNHDHNLQL